MSVFLKAIAQVSPNKAGIEAPSALEAPVEISNDQFLEMADNSQNHLVSFEPDGVSKPTNTTVYRTVGGRYIVAEDTSNPKP